MLELRQSCNGKINEDEGIVGMDEGRQHAVGLC